MKHLWAFLNSPIFLVIFGAALISGGYFVSSQLAAKYRTQAILSGIREAAEDFEKNPDDGAIKKMISAIIGQAAKGIKDGFQKMGSIDPQKDLEDFRVLRQKLLISDVQLAPIGWKGQEKVIGKITNTSDKPLQNIQLQITFFDAAGKLMDVTNKWISEIKVLEPHESIGFSETRSYAQMNDKDDKIEAGKSSKVEGKVLRFDPVEPKKVSDSNRQ
jgi:hypothetical protein